MGKRIANIARLIVSFGAIAALIWLFKDRLPSVVGYLRDSQPIYLVGAFIAYCMALFILSIRLHLFANVQNVNLSVKDTFYLNVIAHFFNNFLPSSMGGDVVKIYYAYKKTKRKVGAFVSIVTDRFCGLITFILFAFLALIFFRDTIGNQLIFFAVMGAAAVSLITVVFFFNRSIASRFRWLAGVIPKKLRRSMVEVYHAFHGVQHGRGQMIGAFFASLLGQVFVVMANFLIAMSLNLPIEFYVFLLMIPLISFVSVLAPSLNGLGIREGAYVYFFSQFVGGEAALALSIVWYGLLLVMSLVGGLWYALQGQLKVSEIREAVQAKEIDTSMNVGENTNGN